MARLGRLRHVSGAALVTRRAQPGRRLDAVCGWLRLLCGVLFVAVAATASAQELPPELTQPVNDFAGVIDV